MPKLIAKLIFGLIKLIFRDKTALVLENLALRHQLSVLKRKKKPKLKSLDRIFWAWLSRIWPSWKSPLVFVKPGTVIKWHRKGFKLYWKWKSRHKVGRPKIPKEVRKLIRQVKIAPKSPWQNPYAERVTGSIRRECLNHFIIMNENHLLKILDEYVEYYNNCRTHLSLNKNSPMPRQVESTSKRKVVAIPKVGGLHHLYKRVA